MDDMTLFLIGGLVTFLFVGGVLQANLYRALRSPESDLRPPTGPRVPEQALPRESASQDPVTAWQTKVAIAAATSRQSVAEDHKDAEQPELH